MDRLTPRQLTIVDLKCRRGLTHEGVGYTLGLSTQTVKNHVSNILQRLDMPAIAPVCYVYGREVGGFDPAALRANEV